MRSGCPARPSAVGGQSGERKPSSGAGAVRARAVGEPRPAAYTPRAGRMHPWGPELLDVPMTRLVIGSRNISVPHRTEKSTEWQRGTFTTTDHLPTFTTPRLRPSAGHWARRVRSCSCARHDGQEENRGGAGQALAEFALVIPIVILVFMGVIEVALAFNATVGVNRASQNGAHLAAILGDQRRCGLLHPPRDRGGRLRPQRPKEDPRSDHRANRHGRQSLVRPADVPARPQRDPVPVPDWPTTHVMDLPYQLTAAGYPEDERCNVLSGCPELIRLSPPAHLNLGGQHRREHPLPAPLGDAPERPVRLLRWRGRRLDASSRRNIFRIEPVL